MEVQAITRYARMSPIKVREIVRVIQGRPASEALELVRFIPRKSARLVGKTLKSAVANAENNAELSVENLIVKTARVEDGPALKRYKAAARGSASPRKKRMSHIRIVLSDEAKPA